MNSPCDFKCFQDLIRHWRNPTEETVEVHTSSAQHHRPKKKVATLPDRARPIEHFDVGYGYTSPTNYCDDYDVLRV